MPPPRDSQSRQENGGWTTTKADVRVGGGSVLVETRSPRQAKAALLAKPLVHSVAQIGASLRVLVDGATQNPADAVQELLQAEQVEARCISASANLEDVFVVATRFGGQL